MTAAIHGTHPDIEALIEHRQKLGLDRHDEVWDGIYHMSPYANSWHALVENELAITLTPHARSRGLYVSSAFNFGTNKNDFRVPDLGVHQTRTKAVYLPTALMVVEVLSPDDESFIKIPHYLSRGVREVMIVDPEKQTIELHNILGVQSDSKVLGVPVADLAAQIDWPS